MTISSTATIAMPPPSSSSLLLRGSAATSIAFARSRLTPKIARRNTAFLLGGIHRVGSPIFDSRSATPWRVTPFRDFSVRAKKNADAPGNGAVDGGGLALKDQNIVPVELHKEATDSYMSYAMSVIIGRALPDVRDGLKPVHRRILFAMHGLGLHSKKPYKKCARVVGEVLGKFHPHGDTAVYDALVRMAQGFSLRSPLISGHGNFGSLDGDPAAAMRYTECRLDPLSEAMLLSDLDAHTVDFVPNFDASNDEPLVLPARLPNVLINGSSGIAVGMATTIPPHNLSEVVDALCALISNPDLTIQEIMELMPGPDFPTGGLILGTSGLVSAYRTGRGQVTVRGTVTEEVDGKGARIVIGEIPYGTNKAALVAKIADLVNNKSLEGVSDVRDESDRSGMRIVIELKKGVIAGVVLNNLYKHTSLQVRYSYNMVGILDKQPQTFGVKQLLQTFLEFRCSVVEKRAQYELKKAEDRDHLLQGFLIGLEKLDDVVKTLRSAKDTSSALEKLQQDFGLSQAQAEGILAMPLRRITSLERGKIEDEHKDLVAQVKDLQGLLASKQRILQVVEKEALALKKEFGTPRRTQLDHDDPTISDMDVIANDETLLTLSGRGYVKRMIPDTFSAQRRGTVGKSGGKLKENDGVADSFICKNHDHVLFFSEKGVVYSLRAYQIPESSRKSSGIPIGQVLNVPTGERITSMFPLSEFKEDQYLVMLTANGYIKRTPLSVFASIRSQGILAIHLIPGDELKWVRQATDADSIFMCSQRGYVVQVPCSFKAQKRMARGVRAMRLRDGDKLAAIDIVPAIDAGKEDDGGAPWLMFVSENGIAKRVSAGAFSYHGLNKVGIIGCKFLPGDRLAEMFIVGRGLSADGESNEELVVASLGGIFNRFKVRDVSILGRMARGVKLMKIDSTDKVKSVTLVPASEMSSSDCTDEETVESAE